MKLVANQQSECSNACICFSVSGHVQVVENIVLSRFERLHVRVTIGQPRPPLSVAISGHDIHSAEPATFQKNAAEDQNSAVLR